MSNEGGELFGRIRLCFVQGLRVGQIRRLSGFNKQLGHREPEVVGERENDFVAQVGHGEVVELTDGLLGRMRSEFGYRRKDVATMCSEGAVSVRTADFELRVWTSQDEEKAHQFQRWVEVASLRGLGFFLDPRFLAVFGDWCNRMVLELDEAMDMEALVDCMEAQGDLAKMLDYPGDLSWCRLKFLQPIMEIRMEPMRIVFENGPGEGLASLVNGSLKAMRLMGMPAEGRDFRLED